MMPEEILFNIFSDVSLIVLAIALVVRNERSLKKSVQALGFKTIDAKALFKNSAKLFFALIAVAFLLGLVLSFFGLNDGENVSETLVEESKTLFPFFFWLIALTVISEEIFFRGFLVPRIGAVPSTAIFAFLHAGYGSILAVVGAFILGLILAKAFELNKNIYPNILAHGAYNAFVLWAIFSVV